MALFPSVKVHPTALFQIISAYDNRRGETPTRLLGALLGSVEDRVVEVTNALYSTRKCKNPDDADKYHDKDMKKLLRKADPLETIVGWWATGSKFIEGTPVIHRRYKRQCPDPIHILIDTTMQNGHVTIKGFTDVPLGVPGGKKGFMFMSIDLQILCTNAERVALNLCSTTIPKYEPGMTIYSARPLYTEPPDHTMKVSDSLDSMLEMMDTVLKYVDGVLDGEREPISDVGRSLMGFIQSVPCVSPQHYRELNDTKMENLLLVMALADMLLTQASIHEKLTVPDED